jgi:hypothetical protein
MPVPLTYSLRHDLDFLVFCCATREDAEASSEGSVGSACLAAAGDDLAAPLTNGALGYGCSPISNVSRWTSPEPGHRTYGPEALLSTGNCTPN